MNINQIVNMVMRMVMKRGLNAGFDAIGRKMSKGRDNASVARKADTDQPVRPRETMRLKKF